MKKLTKKGLIIISLLASFILIGNASASKQDTPVGKVSIESKAVAVGLGYSWGNGVLTFEGKEYPFTIKGLSVIDAGMSSVSAHGEVYGLENASDFSGTFSALDAGLAVGGGAGKQIMKNQNGVVIKLDSKKAGVQLKLAPKGLKVQML